MAEQQFMTRKERREAERRAAEAAFEAQHPGSASEPQSGRRAGDEAEPTVPARPASPPPPATPPSVPPVRPVGPASSGSAASPGAGSGPAADTTPATSAPVRASGGARVSGPATTAPSGPGTQAHSGSPRQQAASAPAAGPAAGAEPTPAPTRRSARESAGPDTKRSEQSAVPPLARDSRDQQTPPSSPQRAERRPASGVQPSPVARPRSAPPLPVRHPRTGSTQPDPLRSGTRSAQPDASQPNTAGESGGSAVGTQPAPPIVDPQTADAEPRFASRAERKRYLREQQNRSESQDGAAQGGTPAASASATSRPAGPFAAQAGAAASTGEHGRDDAAANEARDDAAANPVGTVPAAFGGVPADSASPAGDNPQDMTARRQAAAQKARAAQRSDSDQPDDAAASRSADSQIGDDSRPARRRRSPLVRPPHTEGIKVVTGALPLGRTDVEEETVTETSALRRDSRNGERSERDWARLRERAAGPSTRPLASIDPSLLVDELPDDREGEEVDSPPVPPMSARNVTYEDGEILVGDHPSPMPYVVLGVAGLLAIVLIVLALMLLF